MLKVITFILFQIKTDGTFHHIKRIQRNMRLYFKSTLYINNKFLPSTGYEKSIVVYILMENPIKN